MRLIDGDALPDALFRMHVHDGEELEPMLYLNDAVKVVENAQTIDAIPVEWMRDKMRGYASSLKSTETAALVMVLTMWEKEQEAR